MMIIGFSIIGLITMKELMLLKVRIVQDVSSVTTGILIMNLDFKCNRCNGCHKILMTSLGIKNTAIITVKRIDSSNVN